VGQNGQYCIKHPPLRISISNNLITFTHWCFSNSPVMLFQPSTNPLLWIILSLATGIVSQLCFEIQSFCTWEAVVSVLTSIIFIACVLPDGLCIRALLAFSAFMIGSCLAVLNCDLLRPDHFSRSIDSQAEWYGVVVSEPKSGYSRTRFIIEVKGVRE
jgi:hypothetical protein